MSRIQRFFTAAAVFLLMLSSSTVVFADENATTVKLNVDVKNSYELIIPASTSVTGFGWTYLAGNLKVKGMLSSEKAVEVTIVSANDYQFVNEGRDRSIAYHLRETQEGTAVTQLYFSSADVTVSGDPGKQLGVFVEKDAWNAVPGGEYSDVLTFTAKLTNAH